MNPCITMERWYYTPKHRKRVDKARKGLRVRQYRRIRENRLSLCHPALHVH